MNNTVIDPKFLSQLERFILASRRVQPGLNMRSTQQVRRGLSSEFYDHRPYYFGDDLRYVDWKIYGRLERVFLKLFREEGEIDVHLLIDTSASMGIGEPAKMELTMKLAMALALTGFANHQRVGLALLDLSHPVVIPPGRGRIHRQHLFQILSRAKPDGEGDLGKSLYDYSGYCRRGGLAILISDMLCQNGLGQELDLLLSKRLDLCLIQILAREEIEPIVTGSVTVFDVESGKKMDIVKSAEQLSRYKKKLAEHNEKIRFACDSRKIDLCQLSNDDPLDRAIFALARQGLLRKR